MFACLDAYLDCVETPTLRESSTTTFGPIDDSCFIRIEGMSYKSAMFRQFSSKKSYLATVQGNTSCKLNFLLVGGGGRGASQASRGRGGGGSGHVCYFQKYVTGMMNLTISVGGSNESSTVSAYKDVQTIWTIEAKPGHDALDSHGGAGYSGGGSDGHSGGSGGLDGEGTSAERGRGSYNNISQIPLKKFRLYPGQGGSPSRQYGAGGGGGVVVDTNQASNVTLSRDFGPVKTPGYGEGYGAGGRGDDGAGLSGVIIIEL